MAGVILWGRSKTVRSVRNWQLWLFEGRSRGGVLAHIGHDADANVALIGVEGIGTGSVRNGGWGGGKEAEVEVVGAGTKTLDL